VFKLVILDIKTTLPLFKDLAFGAVLPGLDGEISILDFHQPIVACLKSGEIRINNKISIHIKEGIAGVKDNQMIVFAER
jgi:F0F1-type ATP synthase epsilon subunit